LVSSSGMVAQSISAGFDSCLQQMCAKCLQAQPLQGLQG
jgi:hypothetical protein